MGELSRRRIRSINKLIKVGRNEAVVVVRVDPIKGNCLLETFTFPMYYLISSISYD